MKPFLPFLLVPALFLGGWGLARYAAAPDPLALPRAMALDAPPALGVVIPAADSQGSVRVPVDVLLPPEPRPLAKRSRANEELPKVSAILVEGQRKVAQINGMALSIGETYGLYRVVAIESHRVQFQHPGMLKKRWVTVNE
jgi:hypothetical protein